MFLIPIHILATTLMVIFEENFLSQITLKVVKIADIKFIFNMLSNICHNLMIYILSPCFLPTVQLQLQHPLLVYQTELETCQRCQLGEKSAERGATDLDLGKLLFTYSGRPNAPAPAFASCCIGREWEGERADKMANKLVYIGGAERFSRSSM